MEKSKKTVHIYDDIINNIGENALLVSVGGVEHFVEKTSPYRDDNKLLIYLNKEHPGRSVSLESESISLSRSPEEYARTILEGLDPYTVGGIDPVSHSVAINFLTRRETSLQRIFSPKLFKTLLKILTDKEFSKNAGFMHTTTMNGFTVFKTGQNRTEIPYLSIRNNETDQEIIGRLLCGVFLFKEKKTETQIHFEGR